VLEPVVTLAAKIADGSMAPFILHLVKSKRLSSAEAAEIRRILKRYGAQ